MSHFKRAAVVLLMVGVLLAIALIVDGVVVSLEAEKSLHAFSMVMNAVEEYCDTHGEWPPNWERLAAGTSRDEIGGWKWPQDCDEIKSRIHVDFSVTLQEVCGMSPDAFAAIRQTRPHYVVDDRIEVFLRGVCQ